MMLYVANIRIPTEKAHGLQIMQNCEAFAQNGADVTLWAARRFNTPEMRDIADVHTHYGVDPCFKIRRLPCVDLLPLVPDRTDRVARAIFYLQLLTFTVSVCVGVLFSRADTIYSRDPLVLLALSVLMPRTRLVYEAHQRAYGRAGRWLQNTTIRRVTHLVCITAPLREHLIKQTGEPTRSKSLVAHDGFRAQRFADLPTRDEARAKFGWPQDVFIVGYVGRLHTLKMNKGVDLLIDALAWTDEAAIAIVGGPAHMADELREGWLVHELPDSLFLYAGQLPPEVVPAAICAFDVCAMPHLSTPHFMYDTSPLKLFEYMAAGRAIIASDMPGWADVVTHEENALLVPPADREVLAKAISRLMDDSNLRERLGENARQRALAHYTWHARARSILAFLESTHDASL